MLFVSYAQPLSVAAHTAFFKKRKEGLLKSLILKEGWYPKRRSYLFFEGIREVCEAFILSEAIILCFAYFSRSLLRLG